MIQSFALFAKLKGLSVKRNFCRSSQTKEICTYHKIPHWRALHANKVGHLNHTERTWHTVHLSRERDPMVASKSCSSLLLSRFICFELHDMLYTKSCHVDFRFVDVNLRLRSQLRLSLPTLSCVCSNFWRSDDRHKTYVRLANHFDHTLDIGLSQDKHEHNPRFEQTSEKKW